MSIPPKLIFDVGLFDGEDTAYYLFRGYRVVAVDANPSAIAQARLRFAKEIANKSLTLRNVGVAETSGTATFWISDVPEWSSFNRDIASRDGTVHRPLSVPVMPFSEILLEHGIPHYLKIDIEGNDTLCVQALKRKQLPLYISVETECVGDSAVLSDEQSIAMLNLLQDVGYRKFKLVNQAEWIPVRPNRASQFFMRAVNGVARRKPTNSISSFAKRFADPARIAALGFTFLPGCSGPWGDDVPGNWMSYEKAKSLYLRERRKFFACKDAPLYSFWYDWHATY